MNFESLSEVIVMKDDAINLTPNSPPMSLNYSPIDNDDDPRKINLQEESPNIEHPVRNLGKMGDLRSINEIPAKYRHLFSDHPFFNIIQSESLDQVLYSDCAIVVSAPTGSGKTVLFELAIVQLMIAMEETKYTGDFKIVYVAPVKALCTERLCDWHRKFAGMGLTCVEVTGDTDRIEISNLENYKIIITTPEKWDSMTRKWRDNKTIAQLVKLFMIDEVHLLNDKKRGPTLEAVVSRMKTIQESLNYENRSTDYQFGRCKIRLVAVSATINNIEDIASWLGTKNSPAVSRQFKDDYRPVILNKVVLGYPCSANCSPYKFDLTLNYKLAHVISQYSNNKPTLVFCTTRKGMQPTAELLVKTMSFRFMEEQKIHINNLVSVIQDAKLRNFLIDGVGWHHAGMHPDDRQTTETLFRAGFLPILLTTSTLSMGVNLPAHLVVIKSTEMYQGGSYENYDEITLLQMMGRAGRPQFDTSATAVIMTKASTKHHYESLVAGREMIESSLHKHLGEHLNAEVVLHTITDLTVAMDWIRTTFLHVRALKNPKYYGFQPQWSTNKIEAKLQELCQIEINKLQKYGMVKIDNDTGIDLTPTKYGQLMARYYIAFETMQLFSKINGNEGLPRILMILSEAHEFIEIPLRVSDKRTLNALNKCQSTETIRFPLPGKIKSREMKINCIIQSVCGSLQILDPSLRLESMKIMRAGERIASCLCEYLAAKEQSFEALKSAVILAKCLRAHLWENSPYISRQIEKIGPSLASMLSAAGKNSFTAILASNPRDLERIMNRGPPLGNHVITSVRNLPVYSINVERPSLAAEPPRYVTVTIRLMNHKDLKSDSTTKKNHSVYLLVGDEENHTLFCGKVSDGDLIKKYVNKEVELKLNRGHEIFVHVISESWVGFDIETSVKIPPISNFLINTIRNSNKNSELDTTLPLVLRQINPISSSNLGFSNDDTFDENEFTYKPLLATNSDRDLSGNRVDTSKTEENSKIAGGFNPYLHTVQLNDLPDSSNISCTVQNSPNPQDEMENSAKTYTSKEHRTAENVPEKMTVELNAVINSNEISTSTNDSNDVITVDEEENIKEIPKRYLGSQSVENIVHSSTLFIKCIEQNSSEDSNKLNNHDSSSDKQFNNSTKGLVPLPIALQISNISSNGYNMSNSILDANSNLKHNSTNKCQISQQIEVDCHPNEEIINTSRNSKLINSPENNNLTCDNNFQNISRSYLNSIPESGPNVLKSYSQERLDFPTATNMKHTSEKDSIPLNLITSHPGNNNIALLQSLNKPTKIDSFVSINSGIPQRNLFVKDMQNSSEITKIPSTKQPNNQYTHKSCSTPIILKTSRLDKISLNSSSKQTHDLSGGSIEERPELNTSESFFKHKKFSLRKRPETSTRQSPVSKYPLLDETDHIQTDQICPSSRNVPNLQWPVHATSRKTNEIPSTQRNIPRTPSAFDANYNKLDQICSTSNPKLKSPSNTDPKNVSKSPCVFNTNYSKIDKTNTNPNSENWNLQQFAYTPKKQFPARNFDNAILGSMKSHENIQGISKVGPIKDQLDRCQGLIHNSTHSAYPILKSSTLEDAFNENALKTVSWRSPLVSEKEMSAPSSTNTSIDMTSPKYEPRVMPINWQISSAANVMKSPIVNEFCRLPFRASAIAYKIETPLDRRVTSAFVNSKQEVINSQTPTGNKSPNPRSATVSSIVNRNATLTPTNMKYLTGPFSGRSIAKYSSPLITRTVFGNENNQPGDYKEMNDLKQKTQDKKYNTTERPRENTATSFANNYTGLNTATKISSLTDDPIKGKLTHLQTPRSDNIQSASKKHDGFDLGEKELIRSLMQDISPQSKIPKRKRFQNNHIKKRLSQFTDAGAAFTKRRNSANKPWISAEISTLITPDQLRDDYLRKTQCSPPSPFKQSLELCGTNVSQEKNPSAYIPESYDNTSSNKYKNCYSDGIDTDYEFLNLKPEYFEGDMHMEEPVDENLQGISSRNCIGEDRANDNTRSLGEPVTTNIGQIRSSNKRKLDLSLSPNSFFQSLNKEPDFQFYARK